MPSGRRAARGKLDAVFPVTGGKELGHLGSEQPLERPVTDESDGDAEVPSGRGDLRADQPGLRRS